MKKIRVPALALAGALTLSLVLSACGGKDEPVDSTAPSQSPAASESVVPSETPEIPGADAPASTPGSAGDPETQPTQRPTAAPTQKPVGSHPAVTAPPADAPSSVAISVSDIWADISELDLPAFTDLDDETLTALYGISPSDLEEYVGKIPMMNVQAAEFFLAKVKSGKLDAVKAGLNKRQADLVKEWESYLPEQLELVKGYKLVANGDFVLFAIGGEADKAVEIFNGYTK